MRIPFCNVDMTCSEDIVHIVQSRPIVLYNVIVDWASDLSHIFRHLLYIVSPLAPAIAFFTCYHAQ